MKIHKFLLASMFGMSLIASVAPAQENKKADAPKAEAKKDGAAEGKKTG